MREKKEAIPLFAQFFDDDHFTSNIQTRGKKEALQQGNNSKSVCGIDRKRTGESLGNGRQCTRKMNIEQPIGTYGSNALFSVTFYFIFGKRHFAGFVKFYFFCPSISFVGKRCVLSLLITFA